MYSRILYDALYSNRNISKQSCIYNDNEIFYPVEVASSIMSAIILRYTIKRRCEWHLNNIPRVPVCDILKLPSVEILLLTIFSGILDWQDLSQRLFIDSLSLFKIYKGNKYSIMWTLFPTEICIFKKIMVLNWF